MSQLRFLLRKIMPRLAKEANKLRDQEARSRWMKLKQITESPKSLGKACAFFGWSEDAYAKWGNRLRKQPRMESLFSKSRRPFRSPNQTKPSIAKKALKVRRVEPYLGPERISMELKEIYDLKVAPSTIFSILRRAKVVGKKIAEKLTKKHMKRYRRPWPGYLQMDFKYVPYLIEGKQYYQLSCVDHHSSWRLIRNYRNKDLDSTMAFLKELKEKCPFIIFEIQTDNDTAFTDKFSSKIGVTGEHAVDRWCANNNIIHRLIPVGVKELNGKVENTHKQDDREFFAMGNFKTFESIALNTRGYNDRWNNQRRTKALGGKTPNQVLQDAAIRALALLRFVQTNQNTALYKLDNAGDAFLPIPKPKKQLAKKNRTRKPTYVEKYLKYLEWDEGKKKLPLIFTYPTMSQNSSYV